MVLVHQSGVAMQRIFLPLVATLIAIAVSLPAQGQTNWPRFHGDNGSGVANSVDLPGDWTDQQYDWQIDLPGIGSSSPIVIGDRVFLTTANAETAALTVRCLSIKDGQEIWHRRFESSKHHLHPNNNYASSTLAADETQIYAAFANENNTWLIALAHDGDEVWKRNFGAYVSSHGFGLSPIVFNDKVILIDSQQTAQLNPGQSPGQSHAYAVHKHDGSTAWTTQLQDQRVCYGVPCVHKTRDGAASLINANTVYGFYSIDLNPGVINWTTPGTFTRRVVGSPVIANDTVIATNGSGGGGNYLVAMKLNTHDSTTAPTELYRIRKASYVPSPIVVGGLLYLFTDKGILSCYDAATGKRHYQKRIAKGFSGSPVASADHLYCIANNGDVHVVDVGKTFSHRVADQLQDPSRSTPSIGGNRIFFRTEKKLVALSANKPQSQK
jgi:outer membrane protein assembly factor BamB